MNKNTSKETMHLDTLTLTLLKNMTLNLLYSDTLQRVMKLTCFCFRNDEQREFEQCYPWVFL